jgi:hypothetical protein
MIDDSRTSAEVAQAWVRKMRAGRHQDTDVTGLWTAMSRCESPIELGYCLSLFNVQGITAVAGDFTPAMLPRLAGNRVIAVFAQRSCTTGDRETINR